MANERWDDADQIRQKRVAVAEQVKTLKASGGSAEAIAAAVRDLRDLDERLAALTVSDKTNEQDSLKTELDQLLKQRFFVVPSFEIYGGVAGLYDYGPPGTAVRCSFRPYLCCVARQLMAHVCID